MKVILHSSQPTYEGLKPELKDYTLRLLLAVPSLPMRD